MFKVEHNHRHIFNPIITTDWRWFIRLAWGRRRVSSRAVAGTHAYPLQVTAPLAVWHEWYARNRKMCFDHVVVTMNGAEHGLNYAVELQTRQAESEAQAIRDMMTPSRIADLQAKRMDARSRRDFAMADALRAEIEEYGYTINDERLPK